MGFVVGPSATEGVSPPLVPELELFQKITCLEQNPKNINSSFFLSKLIQILTFLKIYRIHYLQGGIHKQNQGTKKLEREDGR
jgi:hypothetical protein